MSEPEEGRTSENQHSVAIHTSILCGLANDQIHEFDEAFVRFVERHYRHMLSWFERFGHLQEQDREDAVQDFFLSIRRKIRSARSREVLASFAASPGNGKEKFRRWLWRIARNASLDFIGSRKNKAHFQLGGPTDDFPFEEVLSNQIELLLRDDFETMLAEIGKRVVGTPLDSSGSVAWNDWDVFVQRYSMSNEELSSKFGKSVRAIEQSLYRVKKGLGKIRGELIERYGSISQFILADDVHSPEQSYAQRPDVDR